MSPDEWNEAPAWLTQVYIEGLQDQGVLGGGDNKTESGGGSNPGKTPPPVDYAEDPFLPRGFKTRRAG